MDLDFSIKDWRYISWFDAITINVLEYDRFTFKKGDVTLNAEAFSKADSTKRKTDVTLKLFKENVTFQFKIDTELMDLGFATTTYNDPLSRIFKISYGVRFKLSEVN